MSRKLTGARHGIIGSSKLKNNEHQNTKIKPTGRHIPKEAQELIEKIEELKELGLSFEIDDRGIKEDMVVKTYRIPKSVCELLRKMKHESKRTFGTLISEAVREYYQNHF